MPPLRTLCKLRFAPSNPRAGLRSSTAVTGAWRFKRERTTSCLCLLAGSGTSLPIVATLETLDGKELARSQVKTDGIGWKKYETTLHATATDPKARLVLSFLSKGQLWLDFISLFPEKTFRNRPNGLRPDLAQMIADLKPGFIRFPGGCFVEGITIEDRPQWKRSIGALEGRPGTYSPWGYWSTDGLGYHEFLQFADDIGADALYVVNAGISCAFRSGTFIPDDQLRAASR